MLAAPVSAPGFLLEARGIRKSFNGPEVLKGVDLLVAKSQLVFLIGPSGSGKSTLLRCCNRLEEPDGGTLVIDGIDMLSKSTNINAMRRRVGMVFQHFSLYPHLNALGNVTLALRKVMKLPKVEAEEIGIKQLDQVGLADKARAFPAELSGGQQQRVAIARTLALDPTVMLMDEPTSALDPELVESVLGVLRDLREKGMTMVVASHEMRFAREAADRVLFLDQGLVVEEGTSDAVFNHPRHERTRRFLSQVSR